MTSKSTSNLSLVVGIDSQIGRALYTALAAGDSSAMGTSRRRPTPPGCRYLDLAAPPETWVLPGSVSRAYLCAAVTLLETCRKDPAASAVVNVRSVAILGRELAARGAFVVFLSTSLVYDGSVPFRPASDPVCPVTEYGRQKAEAERQLLATGDGAAVVRLTKVFGPRMPRLVQWRAALEQGQVVHPLSDLVMAPVPLPLVVDALVRIGGLRRPGVFQISANRDVSYAEAAGHLAARLGVDPRLVQPVESARAGITLEAAPGHTTLDMSRVTTELGLAPPDAWEAVDLGGGL